MAISKNGLSIVALLVTLTILETGNIIQYSSPAVLVNNEQEHVPPHTTEKRNVLTGQWNYIIDVVVKASNVETFERLLSSLNATILPIQLDNNTDISDISVATVCSSTGTGFQCRCEEQYAWPYSSCVLYGACDYISNGICKCINAIPADGQSCQLISELVTEDEYTVDVELNFTDVKTEDYLRSLLNNLSFSVALGPTMNVTNIDITTVCYLNGTDFQCRCEDQFVWSYRDCITYGACDENTDEVCGCINSIPPDRQYCKPKKVPPVVYEYQIFIEVTTTDADQLENTLQNIIFPVQISPQVNISDTDITTVCSQDSTDFQCRCEDDYLWPCNKCATYGKCDGDTYNTCGCIKAIPTDGQYCQSIQHQNFSVCSPSTAPPVIHEYILSVELNISDVTVINQLRTILSNISYPISINHRIQIFDVNISTVCSPSSVGFQCRCEDHYRWSCDQCFLYGSCDNITDDTCGCINAIPPVGQHCQSADQHNFTACPITSPPSPTTPPVIHEYILSVELNISDVTVINQLKTILSNISYPISINNQIQISDVNISTVCSPSSNGFQCRCVDQYRWSCDQCFLYGSCDNITDDRCGCINAIPPVGQYCQSAYQYNFIVCPVTTHAPSTTPPIIYEYLISVELNISDVMEINNLRTILSNIGYPISINNHMQISDVNISTVCYANGTTFQCRCEEQYHWPCHMCSTLDKCDDKIEDTTTVITTPMRTLLTTMPTVITATGVTSQNTTVHSTMPEATPTLAPTTDLTETTKTITAAKVTPAISFPTTNTTATSTLSTSGITSTTVTGFDVEMLVRLDKEYTAELNDAESSTYKELESRINSVLDEQYKRITGFQDVSVKAFREGSIITEYIVQTTQVIPDEIAEANEKVPEAMRPIAPVLGSVTAFYNSPTTISYPDLTYTGNTMTLTCGPPKNINVGRISDSEWTFRGREIKNSTRMKITTSDKKSMLKVKNVILADIGLYQCTMRGRVLNFLQKGFVKRDAIKQAPVVRLQSKVNVKCKEGQKEQLQCCVQAPYKVKWFLDNTVLSSDVTEDRESYCIKHDYQLGSCSGPQQREIHFTCQVDEPKDYELTTSMTIFRDDFICYDAKYGTGRAGDISRIGCDEGQEGSKIATCQQTREEIGEWKLQEDTCIITEIKELLIDSQDLIVDELPEFVANLNKTVQEESKEIINSSATISAVVDILGTIATVSIGSEVSKSVMENVLETVDVIIGDDARESWAVLNANETRNASSELLGSLETLSSWLVGEFVITTQHILLNRTMFDNNFTADLNSSIEIHIPDTSLTNFLITTIALFTLNNVMPARYSSFHTSLFNDTSNHTVSDNAINAAVVLVQINATIQNVTLRYDKLNNYLTVNPQCVFWNYAPFDNLGAWDNDGCTFISDINNTVTCSCNHLTSFSILMATEIPPELKHALDIITYVGVGISMASLVVCLIIEGFVWKAITRNSTAFMRHVSIVNTALSLLIADICFIIAASIAKNPLENPGEDYDVPVGPCSTTTFFMHFFYLALFFWMLVSGLLLFYRTVMVFSHMSRSTMLAIGFCLGYGCPLIIAVTTVAVTAPENSYIRKEEACWLNWTESKALLSLVIPALTIVFINILIVIVVLFKMLRRGVGDNTQADEKSTLVVIARCVIILTPLFGLTWSLGVGTMVSSTNEGIHIAFAFFSSLQGFFILVFGTIFDSKIRSILSRRLPTSSTGSSLTKSTNGRISSLSGLNWISRLRGRRYIYRLSEAVNSGSSGASESFVNI
ncbi:adhesion G protein-coupled receptor F5-like [Sparus aurata]|uniref:adhesion G protein-coupled receptor F5-like n=1 Tax=Sparus aurata TaxID=8175 RepID=UPI0011C17CE6|nr:adhesion G protein-coupled receptor F5-like [Sparus aurata]